MSKKQEKRGRYFAFILYPEDDYQMILLRELSSPDRRIPCKTMFIHHNKPRGVNGIGKKPHIHVLIKFENARSVSSVQKMLGVLGSCWRLYTMELSDVVDDLKRSGQVVQRVRKEIWSKVPVLSDPDNPASYIDYPFLDHQETAAQVTRRHPIEDNQCYLRTPLYIVKHVEVVDFQAYATYMLHRTFQCKLDGKEVYNISDLRGDEDLIKQAFPSTDFLGDGGMLRRIYDLCQNYSRVEVMQILFDNEDKEAINFLEGHSTFCRDWFMKTKK